MTLYDTLKGDSSDRIFRVLFVIEALESRSSKIKLDQTFCHGVIMWINTVNFNLQLYWGASLARYCTVDAVEVKFTDEQRIIWKTKVW